MGRRNGNGRCIIVRSEGLTTQLVSEESFRDDYTVKHNDELIFCELSNLWNEVESNLCLCSHHLSKRKTSFK